MLNNIHQNFQCLKFKNTQTRNILSLTFLKGEDNLQISISKNFK